MYFGEFYFQKLCFKLSENTTSIASKYCFRTNVLNEEKIFISSHYIPAKHRIEHCHIMYGKKTKEVTNFNKCFQFIGYFKYFIKF